MLHGVDLTVHCGRIHALIGESGSGKSVLARSILGLAGRGARTTGSIRFLGRELVGLSEREYRAIRGADIGLVVQDAMSALNPMRTIGEQLVETIACRHPDFRSGASRASRSSRADRHDIALELLRTVGITAPEKRMNAYAHQLSGGMRQRVMIALALTGSPRLLLADEPTTALDVVVQRELLQEMRALVQARGMSMLIVTHDLNLARDVADDVSVMYAGHVLEEGPVSDVVARPAQFSTESGVAVVGSLVFVRVAHGVLGIDRHAGEFRRNVGDRVVIAARVVGHDGVVAGDVVGPARGQSGGHGAVEADGARVGDERAHTAGVDCTEPALDEERGFAVKQLAVRLEGARVGLEA